MSINKEDVKKVARLARIHIEESDLGKYIDFLNNILPVMDELSKVNTENVEPTTSVSGSSMLFRDDNDIKADNHEDVLANTKSQYGYFTVPKVIE